MPSLIITGYPSSGKTTVSRIIQERARRLPGIKDVIVINEESACPDWTKQECYATSLAEKKTRAALKSAFDRAVATANKQTLVILDSLNYIKGFRYELHCLSKAAEERHGIIWVLNRASIVEEWNENRAGVTKEREAYSKELLRELIQRYEPPDARNRWDKPMYPVDVAPSGNEDSKNEAVKRSVYNMHAIGESLASTTNVSSSTTATSAPATAATPVPAPAAAKIPKKSAFSKAKPKAALTANEPESTSVNIPMPQSDPTAQNADSTSHSAPQMSTENKSIEDQIDEILDSFFASKELREGASTRQHVAASANVLSEVDAISTRLVTAITNAQTTHTGGKLQVSFSEKTFPMNCPRLASLAELRRLRRQYLQWVRTYPPEDTSEKGIVDSFLKYLEDQLQ